MATPFLAEIRMFSFTFPPPGFADCDGQIVPINQNQALFSLLGTTYGGDGETTFALPDLRGRTPIHAGNSETQGSTSHALGQRAGEELAPLTVAQMPPHRHTVRGKAAAEADEAEDRVLGEGEVNLYASPGTNVAMRAGIVTNSGGGAGHPNMQPFLVIRFAIAISGIFPSPS